MKQLVFLAIGMFTVGCSAYLSNGLLPQIGVTLGQPIEVTAQGITLFSCSYLLSAPVFATVFANSSAKKMLQAALMVLVLGNLITLMAEDVAIFLIGRSIAGVGAGIFTPLCVAAAVTLSRALGTGKALSFVWGTYSAGVVFGVPFGLYLAEGFTWQASFSYLIVLGVVSLLGLSFQTLELQRAKITSLQQRFGLLKDQNVLGVTTITCLTCMAGLGLYSYVTALQKGMPTTLTVTVFIWGLGGFVGSSLVGTFVDRTQKPRTIMAIILAGMLLTLFVLPFTKNVLYLGLLPFFFWGAFGWATTTPQQHVLLELHKNQSTLVVALNASAIGLGSALGTAFGGVALSYGVKERYLPFVAAALLFFVLMWQLILLKKANKQRSASLRIPKK